MKISAKVERILDNVTVNRTFLGVGAIISIISTISEYEIGLRLGFLTLFFGGVFRIVGILTTNIPIKRKQTSLRNIFYVSLKFFIWVAAFSLYAFYLRKLLPIL